MFCLLIIKNVATAQSYEIISGKFNIVGSRTVGDNAQELIMNLCYY
jgi:hypothetical protein